jgi:tetratricopeptide (TPR) repeat protein
MSKHKKHRADGRKDVSIPSARRDRVYVRVGLAVIALLTIIAYLPAMNGTQLWDDDAAITRPDLQSLAGLHRIWFEIGATQQYYPLLHTVFWIEHKLWGDATHGYHAITLFWHLTSVVLVYLILVRLKVPGALLAAAIFAVHPVMVESVAWITEQKNTLSTVFYLGSVLAYLKFDQSRKASFYLGALALFALALLSKTATVTLPIAMLVIVWWQRGTIALRHDVLPLAPFFVLAAAAGAITSHVEWRIVGAQGEEFYLTFAERFLVAGRAVWFYIGKLLWPTDLMFVYPRWTLDPSEWWQWLFALAALATTLILWAIRRYSRAPLAAWLYFCGTLFPVLGFLNVYFFRYSFVNDHFQYVASLGMIALVAAGIVQGIKRLPRNAANASAAACVLIVATLAALTWRQSHTYADAITLYQTMLDTNPECWMAHNNLGLTLSQLGNQAEAIQHLKTALSLNPKDHLAENNLGTALVKSGRQDEGIEHFSRSVQLNPDFAQAHANLGVNLCGKGNLAQGVDHLRRAAELVPYSSPARLDYANGLLLAGRYDEAVLQSQEGVNLAPDSAFARYSFAVVLTRTGRLPQARDQLEQALRLQSDYPLARHLLAWTNEQIGRLLPANEK